MNQNDSRFVYLFITENQINKKKNSYFLRIFFQINQNENDEVNTRIFTTDILKDTTYETENTPKKNFKENIKEKYSPKKSIIKHLTEESLKKTSGRLYEKRIQCCRSAPSTPRNHRRIIQATKCTSEAPSPVHSPYLQRHERLSLYTPPQEKFNREVKSEPKRTKPEKHTPKVNRNLMSCYPKDDDKQQPPNINYNDNHVYSQSLQFPSTSSITYNDLNATVPLYYEYKFKENHIDDSEDVNSLSSSINQDSSVESNDASNEAISTDSFMYQNDELSDCEKEVESFFIDKFEPPPHSSTPKVNTFNKFTSTPRRLDYSNRAENESTTTKK